MGTVQTTAYPKTAPLKLARSTEYAKRIMRFFSQADMFDKKVPRELAKTIANQLAFCFSLRCPLDAIVTSIDDLADDNILTKAKARKIAWRLAVNYDRLKRGEPVPRHILTRGVMPSQGVISGINLCNKQKYGKTSQVLQIAVRIWTGPVAGEMAFGELSGRAHHFLNKNLANLPRRHDPLTPKELEGYYISCAVEQVNNMFEFKQIWATAQQSKLNGELYKLRHPAVTVIR